MSANDMGRQLVEEERVNKGLEPVAGWASVRDEGGQGGQGGLSRVRTGAMGEEEGPRVLYVL